MQKYDYILLLAAFLFTGSCSPDITTEEKDSYNLVSQSGGPSLGYSPTSGVNLITEKGYAFKDLNRNGKLDAYEDWRLPVDQRAQDLASQMTVEQIAGLMLYSAHQAIPARGTGFYGGTYNGKAFDESGAELSDLSDTQLKFLKDDNLRHVLITSVESPAVAAQWNNNAQAYVEGFILGVPVNTSSDPRHGSDSYAEYNAGAGGKISMWPSTLGLAASFDPELMRQFGEIAASEYRALGIATALSPQIDLATEPRWSRFDGTMGEDPDLATDMARAYVDGMQTSTGDKEVADGWGYGSVNAMVKHWPGGGPEEGGRDAHFGYGAYAVYPGNNLADHLKPFTEGAFKLKGKTSKAAAVMPYYTISWQRDTVNGEEVGNSYNRYLITDLLREKYGYDGVVCTDWMITKNTTSVERFEGKCWGVEGLTESERHFKALEAGVDQFGGNNDMGPVIEAYQMGVAKYGETAMRERFERSAVRLLRNIFRVGLFENPYLDVAKTKQVVGNPDYMKSGYEAQLRTIVLLKNHEQTLPLKKQLKVYIPERVVPATKNWFGFEVPEKQEIPFNLEVVKHYFEVVASPAEADFALVGVKNPDGGVGYDGKDLEKGGTGYVPISLQYSPYKAVAARDESLAGGSPFEDFTNRSYKGKTVKTNNSGDMEMVLNTKKEMGDKPVIVVAHVSKPMVFSEIEPSTSAILVHMGVQDQALLEIISGAVEPSALLPFQMPANMKTVEEQFEDVPRDMTPYTDSDGNQYDFAFGLNWQGLIDDSRVGTYK
ncbi:glycoside hydrolase family 3 protein [Mangrovibacterium lignilyticum]|uniref:glycoside hydrolase family 3 protein n=1 Tax=Mangrovibacterium lignilyticum TaxID=2668052 RepID=UPI0013D65C9F|nr:glycoside hydrolase family 3 N-terminal domain-containing protein [Mangrovibacterium lignilyticum]